VARLGAYPPVPGTVTLQLPEKTALRPRPAGESHRFDRQPHRPFLMAKVIASAANPEHFSWTTEIEGA